MKSLRQSRQIKIWYIFSLSVHDDMYIYNMSDAELEKVLRIIEVFCFCFPIFQVAFQFFKWVDRILSQGRVKGPVYMLALALAARLWAGQVIICSKLVPKFSLSDQHHMFIYNMSDAELEKVLRIIEVFCFCFQFFKLLSNFSSQSTRFCLRVL